MGTFLTALVKLCFWAFRLVGLTMKLVGYVILTVLHPTAIRAGVSAFCKG